MKSEIAPGAILNTGQWGCRKWWVVEAVSGEWVKLCLLKWSTDTINEPGVMFRTEEKIRRKMKNGHLACKNLGSFTAEQHTITIKPQ